MNQLAEFSVLRSGTGPMREAAPGGAVTAAVTAVEHCLAEAYEQGDAAGVRLLNAVLGLLAALPACEATGPVTR